MLYDRIYLELGNCCKIIVGKNWRGFGTRKLDKRFMRNMKTVKQCAIGILSMLAFNIGTAQGGLSFLKQTHDFGEVKEEEGFIDYKFYFVNDGDDALAITHVEASCGCTTPDWVKEEVMPGDSGFVLARYDPLNKPGKFKKSLTVSFKGKVSGQETLYIEGIVQPKPKTVEDEMKYKVGAIRFSNKTLYLGNITTEKTIEKIFSVFNDGDSAVTWMPEASSLPPHIIISFEPLTLEPDEMGEMKLTYSPEAKNDLGYVSDNVQIHTDETGGERVKEMSVIATIQEYFPPMTDEELAKAPKASFDKIQHDFGDVSGKSALSTSFELINNGQEPLLVRKIKTNCECVTTAMKKGKIKPGKSVTIEVTFDPEGRKGREYKTVTVFTNDPSAPTQMLSLKADI